MPFIIFVLIAWAVFGSPLNTTASWFWSETAAPWEKVDAYYYPDRSNLGVHRVSYNVGSIDNCRRWVRAEALRLSDVGITRGEYECGVGEVDKMGDLTVYRITAR
ncbi:hypothetical protein GGE65_007689 [Skermanella aerolata]|uniref:hypothetical protein n=1 Tax=Skermanella aerolata TaxID=393310 RepID=UPI003D239045